MIRKVRRKFIWITMVATIVCTATIVMSINIVNYYYMDRELSNLVFQISHNDGQLPEDNRFDGSDRGHPFNFKRSDYENKFFSARIYTDGGTITADLKHIPDVTNEQVILLAQQVQAKEKQNGYIGNYKYLVRAAEGYNLVTFLECETKLNAIKSLGWISFVIALVEISLVFLFIALMSKRAIQPLIESSEKQKRFITDASHELKTPLTVISTNMDILTLDLGENEWVKATQKQVSNLSKLVNSLVALSRMEEEDIPLEMQRFDLSGAVLDTITPFVSVAEFDEKTFQADIQPQLFMEGDEGAIRQLVSILCDNAIKYASGDGNIIVTLKRNGKKLLLEVSNRWETTADPKILNHFFDRFYRADESRSKENGKNSYGIGLSIAKAIVEKHHGKISVWQDEQHNIVFSVVFLV